MRHDHGVFYSKEDLDKCYRTFQRMVMETTMLQIESVDYASISAAFARFPALKEIELFPEKTTSTVVRRGFSPAGCLPGPLDDMSEQLRFTALRHLNSLLMGALYSGIKLEYLKACAVPWIFFTSPPLQDSSKYVPVFENITHLEWAGVIDEEVPNGDEDFDVCHENFSLLLRTAKNLAHLSLDFGNDYSAMTLRETYEPIKFKLLTENTTWPALRHL
jgi:hypothetical protein